MLEAWADLRFVEPVSGGARSTLWRCDLNGRPCIARYQAESEASLRWVERAKHLAMRCGFRTAPLIPTPSGRLSARGWTLEPLMAGRTATQAEMHSILPLLRRFHAAARRLPDRPGHPPLAARGGRFTNCFPKYAYTGIHGDLHAGNVLMGPGGPALIDWEESRRDASLFDFMTRGSVLHLAYEAHMCWYPEPKRARAMAARLRVLTGGQVW